MEYTQWGNNYFGIGKTLCLNPCCNGIYSMRSPQILDNLGLSVLILVVMEYTQWDPRFAIIAPRFAMS